VPGPRLRREALGAVALRIHLTRVSALIDTSNWPVIDSPGVQAPAAQTQGR
jgi:hypothetical protein